MQRNFIFAWVLGFSGLAFAGNTQPSYPYPYPIDLHANNRAIAFGSVLMVTENGSDPNAWKKVETEISCGTTGPAEPSEPTEPGKPALTDPNCIQLVYYVTQYNLVECEDGRAYLLRSGEGVSLLSKTEGYFFGWTEGAPCGDIGIPSPPPAPGQEEPAKLGNLNKDRPLDFSRIKKSR